MNEHQCPTVVADLVTELLERTVALHMNNRHSPHPNIKNCTRGGCLQTNIVLLNHGLEAVFSCRGTIDKQMVQDVPLD